MIFNKKTLTGIFLKRPDRFRAYAEVNGETVLTHVPNTGRLKEILIPGVKCLLRKEDSPSRKTKFSMIGAYKNGKLINFDSQAPNKVVEEALLNGKIESLKCYPVIEREKKFGSSRFDFRLSKEEGKCYYLEVKGVTLENNGILSFPDAKTERGARHLRELTEAKKEGYGAGVIFLIQMENAQYFTPNTSMDPDFTDALKEANEAGVDIFAFTCKTDEESLELLQKIRVILP